MLVLVVGALPALRARAAARSRLQGFVAQLAPTAQRASLRMPQRVRRRGLPRPEWLSGREVPIALLLFVPAAVLLTTGQLFFAVASIFQVLVFTSLWGQNLLDARARMLDTQTLPAVLRLSGYLRAGASLHQAMLAIAENSPSPTRDEFARAMHEVEMGASLDDALDALAERIGTRDYGILAQVLTVQRRLGGNLVQVLDQVAETIRQRVALRQEVATLTAQQRLSTWILVLLPYAVLGLFFVLDRGFLAPLVTTTPGRGVLLIASVLQAMGVAALRIVGRISV